jgi:hypothetical protein
MILVKVVIPYAGGIDVFLKYLGVAPVEYFPSKILSLSFQRLKK